MEYKLFSEFITLQALLKEQGIIQSGGAIKSFLENNLVLFNGEEEKRRGKKIRIGDAISIPEMDITIKIIQPSQIEIEEHQQDLAEKERVAQLVKKLNQNNKKKAKKNTIMSKNNTKKEKKPVRFPGI
ncbi:S4 domain-containing protein YaaA [Streptococcus iniae]|uniref:S4 domain-containing protein YaaA n=1 Tax=Streptococcus iniae TaxID=1346 RepID=UPI0008D91C73|nr:S4 domain-containing protein YaaA [Streptococcus iniae]OHX28026.1 hypothetical protein BKX95_02360 [Streptococcus iniae]RLV26856.1 S4 domain-containing protein YaaA [Streptococcus iniae]